MVKEVNPHNHKCFLIPMFVCLERSFAELGPSQVPTMTVHVEWGAIENPFLFSEASALPQCSLEAIALRLEAMAIDKETYILATSSFLLLVAVAST